MAVNENSFLSVLDESEKLVSVRELEPTAQARFNESLGRFMDLLSNKAGRRAHVQQFMLKEAATTADFPILLGSVLDRSLLAKYKAVTPDWRNYINVGTQRDFRPADVIGIYGLEGQLPERGMRAEYTEDAQLGEGRMPQITLKKYGRKFGLAWEALVNDDLGGLSDISQRMAKSALRTEAYQATRVFCPGQPNAALYGTPVAHPIDGGNITNLYTLPFTSDNLSKVLQDMRNQKDADNEPIIIERFHLVFGPALELQVAAALKVSTVVYSGGDATAGTPPAKLSDYNVLKEFTITPHMNPYLPILDPAHPNSWYVFADISDGTAAKVNFLRGHEAPEVVMKAPNKMNLGGGLTDVMEGDFESDTLQYRVRHILGGVTFDPRMAAASHV